jgi:predicted metal-binding protein
MGDVTFSRLCVDNFEKLVELSFRKGATRAKIIDVGSVSLDRRVVMKCEIPPCVNYNKHYFCPPNVMPFDEFKKILSEYKKAIFIQLEMGGIDSLDKGTGSISNMVTDNMETEIYKKYELKLHKIINAVEREAFKSGYYLATGLIGGSCKLCKKCVDPKKNELCRHPFKSRPSMEALGIDIHRTCKNIGMPMELSSKENVRWSGIVLLD